MRLAVLAYDVEAISHSFKKFFCHYDGVLTNEQASVSLQFGVEKQRYFERQGV